MTLRNGKFYNGDQVVPLEFGNREQIKLLNSVKQLQEEGAVPTLIFDEKRNFICGVSLTCVCGGKVETAWETEIEGYEIEGTKVKCSGCKLIYKVCADDDNFLFFKIAK